MTESPRSIDERLDVIEWVDHASIKSITDAMIQSVGELEFTTQRLSTTVLTNMPAIRPSLTGVKSATPSNSIAYIIQYANQTHGTSLLTRSCSVAAAASPQRRDGLIWVNAEDSA